MKFKTALLAVSCLVMCSCSVSPTANAVRTLEAIKTSPQSTPDYLEDTSIFGRWKDSCVSLDQSKVWREGVTGEALKDHLMKNIELVIDDEIIVDADRAVKSMHLVAIPIFNDHGTLIGTAAGPLEICVPDLNLAQGDHLSVLRFSIPSGEFYEYSWIFHHP